MSDHEIFAIVVLLLVAAEMLWFDFLAKPGPRDYGDACFHRLPPEILERIWIKTRLEGFRKRGHGHWYQLSVATLKRHREK